MVSWVIGKLNQRNFALVVGKNRENQENFALVIGKSRENGGFSIKNFARDIGLLFGSAGAHTYLKSGQVAPPPPLENFLVDSNFFAVFNQRLG